MRSKRGRSLDATRSVDRGGCGALSWWKRSESMCMCRDNRRLQAFVLEGVAAVV